jgi:hypothetical protein
MATTANQPYLIRQVDLSDLALIKEILNKKQLDTDSIGMPFMALDQCNQLTAFSSVTICKKICYRSKLPTKRLFRTLSKVFTEKAQSFFEHQLWIYLVRKNCSEKESIDITTG